MYSEEVRAILNTVRKSVRRLKADEVIVCCAMRKEKAVEHACSLRLTWPAFL